MSVSARTGLSYATSTRIGRMIVGATLLLLSLLSSAFFFYFYKMGNGAPSALGFWYSAHLVTVFVSFSLIFVLLLRFFAGLQVKPTSYLARSGLIGLGLIFLHIVFFKEVGHYHMSSGMPADTLTLLKTNLLSLLYAFFAISLLLGYRSMVLFQKTRNSQNGWFAMLFLMACTCLSALFTEPHEDIRLSTFYLLIATVVMMVANSFRVSWILGMTRKEKIAIVVSNLFLFVVLIAFLAIENFGITPGGEYIYSRVYSYPLNIFILQVILFGIIYSITMALSPLFLMPTTAAYKRKEGQIEAFASLSSLTNEVSDLNKLTSTITKSPVQGGMADGSWLTLVDLKSGSLAQAIVASEGLDIHAIEKHIEFRKIYEQVALSKMEKYIEDAAIDPQINSSVNDGIGSLLAIPLVARKQTIGTLFLSRTVSQGFEETERLSVRSYAAQAAMAVDNARLFEEEVEKERLTQELAIAREMQQKLLPRTQPESDQFGMAVSSISAYEVGGDYYDYAQISQDKWAFIVGDVSGKGTSAAFYMAELKGIFQVLAKLAPTAQSFLEYTNEALYKSMESTAFISVVYGILDTRNGVFELARAGHCPILHVEKDGSSNYIRSVGMGLGLDEGKLFSNTLESRRLKLESGDVFVLYSDGVVESRNSEDEEYGYERLEACVSRNAGVDADILHRIVIEDLNEFIGGVSYDDDMTLMMVKWD